MKNFWHKVKLGLSAIYGGRWYKRIVMWFITFILLVLLLLLAVDNNLFGLFGQSPGFSDIKNPETSEASEIYSADSVMLGRYFSENRSPVKYEDISPILIRTLVDTEDERFYKHRGIDYAGLFAAVKDMAGGHARGASTITQQLAKNLFRVRTQYSTGRLGQIKGLGILVMKAKEWIVASKLEMTFTKEDILTMYLNTVDFGCNSYGIKTACRTYFGTTPDHISYEQAAVLVGLLKATSTYNPRLHPDACLERRNLVLSQVYKQGHILVDGTPATQAQFDSICAIPVRLTESRTESSYDGEAPYFRQELSEYISDLYRQGKIQGYDEENKLDLYADGLKIYTTLDTRMQQYAEEAVRKHMSTLQQRFREHWSGRNPWVDEHGREIPGFIEKIAQKSGYYKILEKKYPDAPDSVRYYMNKPHKVKLFTYNGPMEQEMSTMDSIRYMVAFLHTGFVAIEPDTRHVKAWVGDIDYDSWQYDKVTSLRQPGSTFKLFVYTEAMNQGMAPNTRRPDQYKVYADTVDGYITRWAPRNSSGYFSGANLTLKNAFAMSVNSVAATLGYECGIHNIASTAHAMGITNDLVETPSMVLGSSDVRLFDMVNSYCTVANDGKYRKPVMVTKIIDRNGNVIYDATQEEEVQAIPYRSAYLMQQLLQGGMSGTSSSLRSYVNEVYKEADWGGKTGTSNNQSDAWFMGVTPKLVGGAWVGGEYRSIHFRTAALGQGSRMALPIFGYFMNAVMKDDRFTKYHAHFPEPKDLDLSELKASTNYSVTMEIPDSLLMEDGEILEEAGYDTPAPFEESDITQPIEAVAPVGQDITPIPIE